MVDDRITDGRRIAEVLASELEGREDDGLDSIAVENADREVEVTADGARAYDVERDGERLARAYVFPERVAVEFERDDGAVRETAADAGLETDRSSDGVVVTVEDAASVKRAVAVVQAALGPSTE